ncbi:MULTISPECIES: TonB-dependent receptor [Caulobacter]|jgi:TonB-dependent receptor|uniref:TonB-dependent receptor n=1 Tax=Caulobacter vibrioides OR37 TaxID=1292034 RepID=R0EKW1_CAUVI|nr:MULTISPECIES: TonB-dependent receptor [Caulobacter]ENZ81737.1 TonB-dependent receptor [Caulobacter vibrioides OR37]MBQ1561111.1 TonB-dependent receptor [Caulobacter sp.]
MFNPPSRLKLAALTGASVLALAFAPAVHAQTGDQQAQNAPAKPAADAVSELVITGQRLSTANSIDEQKKATGVVNVISADDLGKLPDANVADALARIPGVNVVVNQETGEGEYVSIRGLASTYNAYSINGTRVALTDSSSRKMSMTVLPPNGLKAIAVYKTLTPDLDGDAIGGAVNFVTPTAFDFRKPTLRVFASYGLNDRAQKDNEPAGSGQIQIDVARKFADDRLGLFGSVYYGKSHYTNEETENDGEWEPYHWRKNSTEAIDSRSMYLPGIDLDFRRGEQKRYGGNFSIDYHVDHHEFYVRGQYAKLNRKGVNDYTDERSRTTARLTQVNLDDTTLLQPEQMIIGKDPVKGNIYGYTVAQIVDADKDGLITDADRKSSKSYWSLFGRSGVWNPKAFQFARTFETQDQDSSLYTINAGGHSRFERLTLDYDLSYSYGEKGTPLYYGIGYNCDKCSTDPMFTSTGILWSSADPRFPQAQLPAYAANVDHRDDLLPFDGASMNKNKQSDARTALKVDARYELNGLIDYVKGGFKYLKSEREYDSTPIWEGDLSGTALNGKSLAASGLVERQVSGLFTDRYYYGSIMSRDRVIAALDAARAAHPVSYSTADLNSDDKKGSETIYAGYALAHVRSGALEVIGGARVEHTKVETTTWINDGTTSGFGKTNRDYTNVLPSVTAVYRQGLKLVYRGAIWTSFSRPEYANISRGESVTRDPATKEIIAISRGNPDLKPGESLNFDLSAEYYPDRSSLVSVGVFHKKIKHFIFTNGRSVNADTKNGTITITQPQNGEKATLTGVELNLIKSFEGLGAPFDGFGVEANVTAQTSSAETGLDYRRGHPISFIQAPDLIYNTSLTYQKYGIEAKLSYQYQGAYIEDTRDNAVDKWVQPNKSLDLHTRYNIRRGLTVDFDVQNILDGHRYYTTKGKNPSYQKDYMEPGRNFILRVAYAY